MGTIAELIENGGERDLVGESRDTTPLTASPTPVLNQTEVREELLWKARRDKEKVLALGTGHVPPYLSFRPPWAVHVSGSLLSEWKQTQRETSLGGAEGCLCAMNCSLFLSPGEGPESCKEVGGGVLTPMMGGGGSKLECEHGVMVRTELMDPNRG